jgi:hypothetical protein
MAVALRRAKEGEQEDRRNNIGTKIICEADMWDPYPPQLMAHVWCQLRLETQSLLESPKIHPVWCPKRCCDIRALVAAVSRPRASWRSTNLDFLGDGVMEAETRGRSDRTRVNRAGSRWKLRSEITMLSLQLGTSSWRSRWTRRNHEVTI